MTFVREVQHSTDLESAIINCKSPTVAVDGVFQLSGTPTSNSSISSNSLVLSAGFHFYLEASILAQNTTRDGAITWGFHDGSSYIGQEGFMNFSSSFGSVARVSRRVARTLIINSGSSQTLEVRIKSLTGTTWNLTTTSTGISSFNYVGYPSIRIWELAV